MTPAERLTAALASVRAEVNEVERDTGYQSKRSAPHALAMAGNCLVMAALAEDELRLIYASRAGAWCVVAMVRISER